MPHLPMLDAPPSPSVIHPPPYIYLSFSSNRSWAAVMAPIITPNFVSCASYSCNRQGSRQSHPEHGSRPARLASSRLPALRLSPILFLSKDASRDRCIDASMAAALSMPTAPLLSHPLTACVNDLPQSPRKTIKDPNFRPSEHKDTFSPPTHETRPGLLRATIVTRA